MAKSGRVATDSSGHMALNEVEAIWPHVPTEVEGNTICQLGMRQFRKRYGLHTQRMSEPKQQRNGTPTCALKHGRLDKRRTLRTASSDSTDIMSPCRCSGCCTYASHADKTSADTITSGLSAPSASQSSAVFKHSLLCKSLWSTTISVPSSDSRNTSAVLGVRLAGIDAKSITVNTCFASNPVGTDVIMIAIMRFELAFGQMCLVDDAPMFRIADIKSGDHIHHQNATEQSQNQYMYMITVPKVRIVPTDAALHNSTLAPNTALHAQSSQSVPVVKNVHKIYMML